MIPNQCTVERGLVIEVAAPRAACPVTICISIINAPRPPSRSCAFLVRGSPSRKPTDTSGSGSWSSVGVAGGDAAFAEFDEHGGVVDAQVPADSCQ